MCTGNICRSPTAEAIFRKKVAEAKLDDVIFSDSAATSGHHVGETPDVRAQLACRKRGLDIKEHRAREIAPEDFAKFDLILVMDWENLTDLQHRSPPQFKHKIHLLMRYANDYDAAVVPRPARDARAQGPHDAEEPSGHEGRRLILRTARALKSPLPRAFRVDGGLSGV